MQSILIALVSLLGILAASNLLLTLALARRLAATERAAANGGRGEPHLPRVGAEIGAFSVPTIEGASLTDARLRSGRTLLVFSMAGCSPCAALAEELRRTELPSGLTLLVLVATAVDDPASVTAVEYPAMAEVAYLPEECDLIERLEVDAFPTLVLVEEGRIVAAGRKPGEVLTALTGAPA
jgi:hypothetical protein